MCDITQVVLQFPQFPSPFTTIVTVCAENMKLCQGPLQAFIRIEFKVVFPTCRTVFMFSYKTLTTHKAEVGTTTFRLVWISEYQAAYWTFRLKSTQRWFDKLAIISAKCHLFCPALRLCPSHSSQWCVGGWSFLLLSKFCLLCVYIWSQNNKRHNSYQIIATCRQ